MPATVGVAAGFAGALLLVLVLAVVGLVTGPCGAAGAGVRAGAGVAAGDGFGRMCPHR
jgi:hypothetical protein